MNLLFSPDRRGCTVHHTRMRRTNAEPASGLPLIPRKQEVIALRKSNDSPTRHISRSPAPCFEFLEVVGNREKMSTFGGTDGSRTRTSCRRQTSWTHLHPSRPSHVRPAVGKRVDGYKSFVVSGTRSVPRDTMKYNS